MMRLFVFVGVTVLVTVCHLSSSIDMITERPWFGTIVNHLRPKVDDEIQAVTVVQLIARVLSPGYVEQFEVIVNGSLGGDSMGRDFFVLETVVSDGATKLRIIGTTGVTAAAGFHYYLKRYCGGHVSWSGNQVHLPDRIPTLIEPETVVANDLVRYYENVCTASYSFVWWDWPRWEREIDWMALNWINLPLAFNGQEEIYRRVLLKLNFTQPDLDSFFAGPAFLAWNRMGNLDGWGGPLPEDWYSDQLGLQKLILERMRDFGMIPVLPAFSGHVPAAIRTRYPLVNVTRLDSWNGFNETYSSTYLLDHREELFQVIGKNYIDEMRDEFGIDHIYGVDTFNEMTPPSEDLQYIASIGEAVYSSLVEADPDAIWLMQGWLFLDPFWTRPLAKALLTSVPLGRMIVLDLHADIRPVYSLFESFYGQPFVWCMLHNFGGADGLYGAIANVNRGPFAARMLEGSTMIGTGITPEGINQNDVMYELMNEMSWRRQPVDVDVWMADYAARRYGAPNDDVIRAWQRLARSAYNCTNISFKGNFPLTKRPNLKSEALLCYNIWDVTLAAQFFTEAASSRSMSGSDLFMHDYVDVSRELGVAVVGGFLFQNLVGAFHEERTIDIQVLGEQLSDLMTDLDEMLNTDHRFRLSSWLASARSLARNEQDADQYEYNARNQITLWGPNGEIVDYANKQWAGIFSDYYKPRWSLFVDQLRFSLNTSASFNQTKFREDVFVEVEEPFTLTRSNFTVNSEVLVTRRWKRAALRIVNRFNAKWMPLLQSLMPASIRNSESDLDVPLVFTNKQWQSGQL